jgi:hypothetical protein
VTLPTFAPTRKPDDVRPHFPFAPSGLVTRRALRRR